jgi:hypothetical protein
MAPPLLPGLLDLARRHDHGAARKPSFGAL